MQIGEYRAKDKTRQFLIPGEKAKNISLQVIIVGDRANERKLQVLVGGDRANDATLQVLIVWDEGAIIDWGKKNVYQGLSKHQAVGFTPMTNFCVVFWDFFGVINRSFLKEMFDLVQMNYWWAM